MSCASRQSSAPSRSAVADEQPKFPHALHVAIILKSPRANEAQRQLGCDPYAVIEALKRTVDGARRFGLGRLSVFGLSTTEPDQSESDAAELIRLLRAYLFELVGFGGEMGLCFLGPPQNLPEALLELSSLALAEQERQTSPRFQLQLALNHDSRADITAAAARYAQEVASGVVAVETLNEKIFSQYLPTASDPPIDLIIRTSGEQGLSNCLLWEAAYAELAFQDVPWADYRSEHLKAALDDFGARERRYGGR